MGLSKASYEERKKLGLCIQCNLPTGGGTKCEPCKQKDKECRQKRRENRKSLGLCTECKEPAALGYALCQVCIDKSTQGSLNRYYRNKEAGVCRACGEECGEASRCEKCAARFRETQNQRVDAKQANGICTFCPNPARSGRKTCVTCAERIGERQKQSNIVLRDEVFAAYDGPVCVGCGESEVSILQMDHIDGGGNAHRREIGHSKLYKWLKRNGFPKGFRVLCASCNTRAAKGIPLPNEVNKSNEVEVIVNS